MKAFPQNIDGSYFDSGMDLRDYFAAKAMPILIEMDIEVLPNQSRKEIISQMAYSMADAMMKAREQ